MASVVEVWRYPVKSMAGERLGWCAVKETGLEGDRRWALIDGTPSRAGKALTIREHNGLMTYQARLANGGVELLAPDGSSHDLDRAMVARLAAETSRPLTVRKLEGGNFDDSPVLVINLASVAAFGEEAGMALDRRRFRANVYVEGFAPEEETGWLGRRIQVGGTQLEAVSRCERCVVITRDPDTTRETAQLLRLLTETRDTCMGVYCRVVRPGRVAQGDPVRVVSVT